MRWIIWTAVLTASLSAMAADDTNLLTTLRNGGFEAPSIITGAKEGDEPEGWFFFCSDRSHHVGITDSRKHGGMQSLLFRAQTPTEAYEGFAQKFAVTPDDHHTLSAWVLNDPQDPMTGEAYGEITDDPDKKAEGEMDKTKGTFREGKGDLKNKIEEGLDKI